MGDTANVDVPEIEITPKMIKVGTEEFYCRYDPEPTYEEVVEIVEAIYRAMAVCSPRGRCEV